MASTNFVNGVTLTDSSWFNDVDTLVYGGLTSVTGTNTVTASGPQGLTAYALGQIYRFVPSATNTGPVTLNISSLGAKTVLSGGQTLVAGEIRSGVSAFAAYDGTAFHLIGPFCGGYVPGRARFGTATDLPTTPQVSVQAADFGMAIKTTNATAGDEAIRFYNGSSAVGSITTSNTNTAYNTSSDYRLKENPQPIANALADVMRLKPCTWIWKSNGSAGEGFIAHELAEVCPQAVTGEKDAVNEDGTPDYQAVDASFLIGKLTAAIQELKAEFDTYRLTHP